MQPIVGYYSDRTWNGLGRRRPYFLAGAVLTTLALFAMPNSPSLWIAAGLLWILDASLNISMEPFRAFVGDQLSPRQRPTGYAMQSFFIGIGAVVASLLPWLLAAAGVQNSAEPGSIPDTVKYAFYAGGTVLFLAALDCQHSRVSAAQLNTSPMPRVATRLSNASRARRDGLLC